LLCFLIELTSFQSDSNIIPSRDLLQDIPYISDVIDNLYHNELTTAFKYENNDNTNNACIINNSLTSNIGSSIDIQTDVIDIQVNEIKNNQEINIENKNENLNLNQDAFSSNTSIKYQYFKYNIQPMIIRYVDLNSKDLTSKFLPYISHTLKLRYVIDIYARDESHVDKNIDSIVNTRGSSNGNRYRSMHYEPIIFLDELAFIDKYHLQV
jgi:hypothetical protein